MTKQQAIEKLSYHSGRCEDIENPKWRYGFWACLDPIQG